MRGIVHPSNPAVGRRVRHEFNSIGRIISNAAVGPCSRFVVQALGTKLIPQLLRYRQGGLSCLGLSRVWLCLSDAGQGDEVLSEIPESKKRKARQQECRTQYESWKFPRSPELVQEVHRAGDAGFRGCNCVPFKGLDGAKKEMGAFGFYSSAFFASTRQPASGNDPYCDTIKLAATSRSSLPARCGADGRMRISAATDLQRRGQAVDAP